jgi:hypothetical protein
LRGGRELPTEPLECAFLGVDLRRLQPTLLELVELARKRLDLADEPSELTPAAVGANGLAVRPVVMG